jgi:superfamily I DNA and/or RNA helicase
MAAEKAEFFFKPQRLNVAITRAKMKRITLGSSNLFKARSENPDLQKCMDLFRAFYEASKVVRYDTTADIDLF